MVVIIDFTGKSISYDKGLHQGFKTTLYESKLLFIYPSKERSILKFLNDSYLRKILVSIYAILCYLWILISPRVKTVHWQWFIFDKYKIELFFIQLFQLTGKKIIITVHNALPHDSGNQYFKFYQRIYQKVDRIICHSRSSKKELINEFSICEKKIDVIPHGVTPQPIINTKNKSEKLRILIFGQIRKYKGIQEFISEIWNKTHLNEDRIELFIIGKCSKSTKIELNRLINSSNKRNIYFKDGFVPTEQLNTEIKHADFIVFPYTKITTSGAFLQAIANRANILCTSLSYFKEYKNDFSDLVNIYQDSSTFDYLLGNNFKTSPEKIKIQFERFLESHNWNNIAKSHSKSYGIKKNRIHNRL